MKVLINVSYLFVIRMIVLLLCFGVFCCKLYWSLRFIIHSHLSWRSNPISVGVVSGPILQILKNVLIYTLYEVFDVFVHCVVMFSNVCYFDL